MNGKASAALVAFFSALAAFGCGDGTGPRDGPAQYFFELRASGADTTPERVRSYECSASGAFQIERPVASTGEARFPLLVRRWLFESRGAHTEVTLADSTIAEAVLVYSGLGESNLSWVLTAGPYGTNTGPNPVATNFPQEYTGEWTCGPEVPLAQDSTLLAYGYDPSLQLPGLWRLFELLPIE